MLDQITKQLRKLIDVIKVEELSYEDSISRELLLLTIFVPKAKRTEVVMLANTFGAVVANIAEETMTLEFTGNSLKINNIIKIIGGIPHKGSGKNRPPGITPGKQCSTKKLLGHPQMDPLVQKAISEAVKKEPFAQEMGMKLVLLEENHSIVEMPYISARMDNLYQRAHGGGHLFPDR